MIQSLSLLSKVELFTSFRQRLLVFVFFLFIFFLSLFNEYLNYKNFTQFDDFITKATVLKQYKKSSYWVLKLKSEDGFSFYTTSKSNLKNIQGYKVDIQIFNTDINFISFVKGFYTPSFILSRDRYTEDRFTLIKHLKNLHVEKTAPIFSALFLAGNIPPNIRDKLSALGVNHLLAISGFHLGVLSFILFFILKLIYKPIQLRCCPYRNSHRDIALLVLVILFSYLYFLDFVPSLLRAFAMSAFAYFLYDRAIKILSFSSLFLVVSFLIALYPTLLFSIGFFFSIMGVFYIFLFLHYMKDLKVWQQFLLINFWVYLAMIPIVHYFFGTFSFYQLASPILTMLFIIFYPLEIFLHVVLSGDELDFILKYLINLDIKTIDIVLPTWIFVSYLAFSILSIWNKKVFYLLFLFSFATLGYFLYCMAQL